MAILSELEKEATIEGIKDLLDDATFDLQHCDIARPQREVMSDRPGHRKYEDTGVRIIVITGTLPVDPLPGYGPKDSETADVLPEFDEELS